MSKLKSLQTLESWIDSYLNFEKTPKKNIFWLDTMRFFCEKFGHPENFAPCFHIAGSKGKGSVSVFIASILDAAGYKTGLYTSPHILDFIERVSSAHGFFDEAVYDRAVSELMNGVQSVKTEELPAERPITWFELVTLFSFLTFRQAKVDYSVFEVGLGGRLDSTNVVNPLCSVITPIELEHTEFLGDTIEKIAAEKGGIIKENTPVIIAQQQPTVRAVFEKIAKEKHAPVIFAEDVIQDLQFEIKNISKCIKNNTKITNSCLRFDNDCAKNQTSLQKGDRFSLMTVCFSSKIFFRSIKTDLRLVGKFQAENAALAALAVKIGLPQITEEQIERGLSNATLPARFEILENPLNNSACSEKNPLNSDDCSGKNSSEEKSLIVLDGAHTVNSVRFTMETMRQVFGTEHENDSEPIHEQSLSSSDILHQSKKMLLFACAADKDAHDIAPLFKDYFSEIFLTKPGEVKQSDLTALTRAFDNANIPYDCSDDYKSQSQKALKKARAEKAILLVTGSFYLIAEVKKRLLEI